MASDAVKVALQGPDGEVETLWANPTPDGLYALDNLPWYAYGVSVGDVVAAEPDAGGLLFMTRVVRKSGNRTVRVILDVTDPAREWTYESRAVVAGIREHGCEIENMNRRLVAVNVPPEADLAGVAAFLTEAAVEWEYADPTYEDLFPRERVEADEPEV